MRNEKLTPVLGVLIMVLAALFVAIADIPSRLAAGSAIPLASAASKAVRAQKAPSEPPLSVEQDALAQHLAVKYKRPSRLAQRIVKAAYSEANRADMSPLLVLAVIEKESSLNPTASNSYGAVGLMQVVPRYHRKKLPATGNAEQALHDPELNIRVGTRILAEYRSETGGLTSALGKYSGQARNYAHQVGVFKKELEGVKQKAHARWLDT